MGDATALSAKSTVNMEAMMVNIVCVCGEQVMVRIYEGKDAKMPHLRRETAFYVPVPHRRASRFLFGQMLDQPHSSWMPSNRNSRE